MFVILGMSRSGKSSLLSMLSGEKTPTKGSVFISGHDVRGKGRTEALEVQGCACLCLQENPLPERMTAREMLGLFGRLRGISVTEIDTKVDRLLHTIGLA